ncbi:DNA polymerase-3 subunit epsilon [Tessaracoccus bendigoensis DSM 12906]|uniref:DNA polymerase-3 subunit epsilon n=1 Tax=Tessaracoccus bendigoensis DSM 12906 TaxID=1123357 RepID=A0A1M6HQ36_9ACTN|nr:3'-5' exonuclease [Tessaracoccus bendigoensis]SHJ24335.1 DNA polymerase-3 subunit epsilon [Tessaracoccus bendigoensis DSM 12906]
MRWPFRKSNAALAAEVPDGGLRHYLATPPPPRTCPIEDLPLLAIDFETTGLDADRDHIVSAGMLDVEGLTIPLGSAANILVNPGHDVGQSAVIHQLTDDELLADGVPLAEALDLVFDRLAGRVLLAHHCAVEVGFLTVAVRRLHGIQIDLPAIDTLTLGHRALGMDEDHPPDALRLWRLRRRSSLPTYRGHDAVVDALACAELWLALAQELRIGTLRQALRWS